MSFDAQAAPDAAADPFRQFLHTTFVTYNPIYLASAALVLAGLWLVSHDLATRGGLYGLGVSGIAELYAIALIGSAAILFRTGQRRVAVMLGLLAAVYMARPADGESPRSRWASASCCSAWCAA